MANVKSEQVVYLHGNLDLHVIEARRLPNMGIVFERFRRYFMACDTINCSSRSHSDVEAEDHKIHHHNKIITSDSYVNVVVPQATVARTRVMKNSQSPQWRERFVIQLAHPMVNLKFQVKDNDVFDAKLIGTATISAAKYNLKLIIKYNLSHWFHITVGSPNGQVLRGPENGNNSTRVQRVSSSSPSLSPIILSFVRLEVEPLAWSVIRGHRFQLLPHTHSNGFPPP